MKRKTLRKIASQLDSQLPSSSKRSELKQGLNQLQTKERIVTSVPYPNACRLKISDIWSGAKINCELLRDFLYDEGRLAEECALKIIREAAEILKAEKNLLTLSPPINICGDVHGQYYDMLSIFKAAGDIPNSRYLFLGDYVDRGCFGIEIILLIFAYKISYPKAIYLLRGNHESRAMTESVSFLKECLIKYSQKIYDECIKAFNCLPLAAVVDERFFCVHAGIGPDIYRVEDINKIHRFVEIPTNGPFCDIVWSDPSPHFDTSLQIPDFAPNFSRNVSYFYSYNACCNFLSRNNLLSLIRGHSIAEEGFKSYRNTAAGNPSVLNIFSAPCYVDVHDNKAAVLNFDGKRVAAIQFTAVPHPYYLPNFLDAITYTLPFIVSKISEILYVTLKYMSKDEVHGSESTDREPPKSIRFLRKVLNFGRAAHLYDKQQKAYEDLLKVYNRTSVPSKSMYPIDDGFKNRLQYASAAMDVSLQSRIL